MGGVQTEFQLSSPQGVMDSCYLLLAPMHVGMYSYLPPREAHLSLGVQDWSGGFIT